MEKTAIAGQFVQTSLGKSGKNQNHLNAFKNCRIHYPGVVKPG